MTKKAIQARASKGVLLAIARRLFCEQGFGQTSTEQVLEEAGLTRGALYYHFSSKQDLFAAVLRQIHEELVVSVRESHDLEDGLIRWVLGAAEATRARPLLVDGPSVLGVEAWREMDDAYGGALLVAGVAERSGGDGVAVWAAALNGACNELAVRVWQGTVTPDAASAVLRALAGAIRAA